MQLNEIPREYMHMESKNRRRQNGHLDEPWKESITEKPMKES